MAVCAEYILLNLVAAVIFGLWYNYYRPFPRQTGRTGDYCLGREP
jgi:hypothetical protein